MKINNKYLQWAIISYALLACLFVFLIFNQNVSVSSSRFQISTPSSPPSSSRSSLSSNHPSSSNPSISYPSSSSLHSKNSTSIQYSATYPSDSVTSLNSHLSSDSIISSILDWSYDDPDIKLMLEETKPQFYHILHYTNHWGDKDWPKEGEKVPVPPNSQVQCEFTYNKDRITTSPLIIFHLSDFKKSQRFPLYQNKYQGFVLRTLESPTHVEGNLNPMTLKKFNYLWNYRYDADIINPYVLNGYPYKLYLQSILKPLKPLNERSKAPVSWIASNCHAFNLRQEYIRKLRQYIEVDCLGSCLNNQPMSKTLERGREWEVMGQYKFYLSFENSNCDYYITEKLGYAFFAGTLPVVFGAPKEQYSYWIPNNHSVIFAEDFSSPQKLAQYLLELHHNDHLYLQYFQYKLPSSPVIDPHFFHFPGKYPTGEIKNTKFASAYVKLCALAHRLKILEEQKK